MEDSLIDYKRLATAVDCKKLKRAFPRKRAFFSESPFDMAHCCNCCKVYSIVMHKLTLKYNSHENDTKIVANVYTM